MSTETMASTREPRSLDYPSFLPPMLVKELRQLVRTKGFLGVFLGLHGIMMFLLFMSLLGGEPATSFFTYNIVFWILLSVALLIITPLRGMNTVSHEIESRGLDLLLLTRLSAFRIVVGKWGALFTTGLLFSVSLLPYGVLRYFLGSVNLVNDCYLIFTMMMVSGGLTALAVWTSGQAKLLRVLIPMAVIFYTQVAGSRFLSSVGVAGSFLPMGSVSAVKPLELLGFVLAVAVLSLYFLLLASRRLSAPSDNPGLRIRCLVLGLLFVGVPLLHLSRSVGAANFLSIFVLIACGMEMAQVESLMPVHWKTFLQRPWFLRLFGPFLLPGWVSAAFFSLLCLALLALAGLRPPLRLWGTNYSYGAFLWILVLTWQAFLFPSLLMSFFPAAFRRLGGAGTYFVLQGVFLLFSAFANSLAGSFASLKTSLLVLGHFLPCTSLWLTLYQQNSSGLVTENVVGQLVMLVGLLALFWARAQPSQALLHKENLRWRREQAVPKEGPEQR